MIFHASIPANNPRHVASVLAEIWKTDYFPFVFPGSYIVISGNSWGSNIEVLQRGDEQVPGAIETMLRQNPTPSRYSELHLLIGTDLSFDEVLAIAAREKWIARVCDRKFFSLVEIWLENSFLIEITTGSSIESYRRFYSSVQNWRGVLEHQPMPMPQFGYTNEWLDEPRS